MLFPFVFLFCLCRKQSHRNNFFILKLFLKFIDLHSPSLFDFSSLFILLIYSIFKYLHIHNRYRRRHNRWIYKILRLARVAHFAEFYFFGSDVDRTAATGCRIAVPSNTCQRKMKKCYPRSVH